MFFIRPLQRQACDVEGETKERNIQQRNVRDRNEPSRTDYPHDDFRYRNEQEGSWIFFHEILSWKTMDCN